MTVSDPGPGVPIMLDAEPFSTRRFLLSILVAHLAAAYAMGASMLLTAGLANLFEPDTFASGVPSLGRIAEGVLCFPLVALGIALPAAMLLLPYTAIGALMAWPIVATRCVGPLAPSTIGGGVGTALGAICLWRSALVDGLAQHWIAGTILCEVDAMATGAVFGFVVWCLAIRPRQGRSHGPATSLLLNG